MNVLAFDTSLGAVSVAVGRTGPDGATLLHEAYEERAVGHAERLMPMIDACMKAAGMSFSEIDRIAVTVGPGTFTGVRTCISAARALALATGAIVVGMTSLAVIAHRTYREQRARVGARPLTVVVDAHRGGFYLQTFAGPDLATLSAASVAPVDDVRREIETFGSAIVGSGVPLLGPFEGSPAPLVLDTLQPHARSLCLLAGTLQPEARIKPLYLRPPDAKPQTANVLARAQ